MWLIITNIKEKSYKVAVFSGNYINGTDFVFNISMKTS